jgi:hypothetical protein
VGVDGNTIFKWIIKKYGGWLWIGFIWLRIGAEAGSSELDNDTSGYIKVDE